ncbi:MAG: alcohol dehydrogenase catalytic domain-containing protein [Desulfomonilaceae bacterium]|jgi:threonine dehydrogenase-like Zn-dependent dehydrogenase
MKALFFNGSNLELTERPTPDIRSGESLVRVLVAGICRTDIEIMKGYMNFAGILGHEFVGEIVKSDDSSMIGKRVVGEINAGCGKCDFCRKGLERHCADRTTLGIAGRDGAFAEYLTLPTSNLVEVPDSVSNEKAVFVEPLAAAVEILEQIHLAPASRVLIIGDGRLSALTFLVLRLTGSELTVLSKHHEKKKFFDSMGARVMSVEETQNKKREFDFVVEASGSPSGWITATELVKPRGTIVLKSTYHGKAQFDSSILVINEISVVGSRCGQFKPALRILNMGLADPSSLISGSFTLDNYRRAFEQADSKEAFKTLITM